MKHVNIALSYKELFILDHALNHYMSRTLATQSDINDESELLNRLNDGIKALKWKKLRK